VDYAVIFVAINLASFPIIIDNFQYMVNISINATNVPVTISATNEDDPEVMVPNNNISMRQSPSNSSDATFVMHNSNEISDTYNMTIIIGLHNNSGADTVNVTVMSEEGMDITGKLSIIIKTYVVL